MEGSIRFNVAIFSNIFNFSFFRQSAYQGMLYISKSTSKQFVHNCRCQWICEAGLLLQAFASFAQEILCYFKYVPELILQFLALLLPLREESYRKSEHLVLVIEVYQCSLKHLPILPSFCLVIFNIIHVSTTEFPPDVIERNGIMDERPKSTSRRLGNSLSACKI